MNYPVTYTPMVANPYAQRNSTALPQKNDIDRQLQTKPKASANMYWKAVGGVVLTTLATVGAVKGYKFVKFRNEIKKVFESCWEEAAKGPIAQKIGLKKPKLKIPFFYSNKNALANYDKATNTMVINYKSLKNQKFAFIAKEKGMVAAYPHGTQETLGKLKKNGTLDKFDVIELNDAEKLLVFKKTVAHELRHSFQFQAMLNSSQVGKEKFVDDYLKFLMKDIKQENLTAEQIKKEGEKQLKKHMPFVYNNEFKSVDIPKIYESDGKIITPQDVSKNFIEYASKKGDDHIKVWASNPIEADAEFYSINTCYKSEAPPTDVRENVYKSFKECFAAYYNRTFLSNAA